MLFIRMAYRLRWADRPALARRNGRVHRRGLAPPRPVMRTVMLSLAVVTILMGTLSVALT